MLRQMSSRQRETIGFEIFFLNMSNKKISHKVSRQKLFYKRIKNYRGSN